jgi:hypothetical protein
VALADSIGDGVIHAFNSFGMVWFLVVDLLGVFRRSFGFLVLALRV